MERLPVLLLFAVAAVCAWWVLWGARPHSEVAGPAAALHAAASSGSLGSRRRLLVFRLLWPLIARVERQFGRLNRWSGFGALLRRDQLQLVRSGLQDGLSASTCLALRLTLALILPLTLGLVLFAWTMGASIALIPEMPPLVQQALLAAVPVTTILGALWPGVWLARLQRSRQRNILRALPFILDLLTLSVESGASLALALAHAADKGPAGPLRDELRRMLDEVKTGRARSEALRAMADRVDLPAVSNWVAAMISAQQQGSSLGPLMRAQAEQRRQERFLHAEKVAMKAPVKMLFPLLVFIFPCTFLLLFFPVVVRLLQEGVLR